MVDYHIQPNSRVCAASGRELKPGERYFSALLDEGGKFTRKDYAKEAWTGPPEGTFSFWTGKVPTPSETTKPRFDDDVLEDCFHRLEGQLEASQLNFRYVVALLLIRRKRFRFESTVTVAPGEEQIALTSVKTGEKYQIPNPHLSDAQMAQVQEEVFRVLGWS